MVAYQPKKKMRNTRPLTVSSPSSLIPYTKQITKQNDQASELALISVGGVVVLVGLAFTFGDVVATVGHAVTGILYLSLPFSLLPSPSPTSI